jgi:hypothetical protein
MSLREEQNELDWLALQYIAGDLDSVATERFELRLADDQAAREAVARAVELTQVVAAAESQSAPLEYVTPAGKSAGEQRSSDWSTRLSWMAIGGLLSLLVAVLATSGLFNRQPAGGSGINGSGVNGSGELAAAWSLTREELTAAEAESIGPLHPISLALSDSDDEATEAVDEALLLVDTPSWMTAAVAGVAGQGSAGSPNGSTPDDEESSVN